MVTAMFLRMILYAPILGIGGIIKVVQTDSGMEWVIVVAVAAIMIFSVYTCRNSNAEI